MHVCVGLRVCLFACVRMLVLVCVHVCVDVLASVSGYVYVCVRTVCLRRVCLSCACIVLFFLFLTFLLLQRRLSVAIAAIGDPPIIFLDEPTSGLDPKNRRSIWKMITNMRRTSLVVLTTHSMEEADTLGDKICLMALGRLRAIGTSTHLKTRFGYGYHINMVVPPHRTAEAKIAVWHSLTA